jgi:hypothetical protein
MDRRLDLPRRERAPPGNRGRCGLLKSQVSIRQRAVRFDYVSKRGQRRVQEIDDPDVRWVVTALKRRRGGGEELLAYKESGRWVELTSTDIDQYIDPRVFDRYLSGWMVAPALEDGRDAFGLERKSTRQVVEEAVVDLISEPRSSDRVERVS